MATRPQRAVVLPTGETEYVDLTDEEIAALDAERATAASDAEADEAAATTSQTLLDRLTQGIAEADTHIANISAASPTAAQQKQALLFALRGFKALARLQVRALDSAD